VVIEVQANIFAIKVCHITLIGALVEFITTLRRAHYNFAGMHLFTGFALISITGTASLAFLVTGTVVVTIFRYECAVPYALGVIVTYDEALIQLHLANFDTFISYIWIRNKISLLKFKNPIY